MTVVKAWGFWMLTTVLCLALLPVFALVTRLSPHLRDSPPQARRGELGLPVR